MSVLVVIAKACLPGKVKTRLHPPYTLEAAAAIAEASLRDTLGTAARTTADRRILYFDGEPSGLPIEGFEVVPQRQGTLDQRIGALFDQLDGPTLLIGMDTPQVTPADLRWPTDTDAVIGMAEDGGFWALGLRAPRGDLVRGVPMSRADTGARQLSALVGAGLTVERLRTLRDIDLAADAAAVAAGIPDSRLARAVAGATREGRAA
ncbi:TIGR04282 family arsenosugar biosynthesis glycosyltransferase [Micromonospora sp. DT81.3]|uniref:TIGR04282 family arsenosugar biosynthesis glycosyltransferase n=1 Tax=Actinomycetes TaxID=1760 RepID=UPI003CF43CE2